jgi:hypothetical protein
MKSAAADQWPTDGATGQPLRAADVELQSSKLSAIREAERLGFDFLPPDEEGDGAAEVRYMGVWRVSLCTPAELVPIPHDPSTCPCSDDVYAEGPCRGCREVFAMRRRAS